MGDVSPSNSTEDEIVKFTVIRTSDAARKEVSSIDFHIEMNVMCVYMVSLRVREYVCAILLLHFSLLTYLCIYKHDSFHATHT